MYVHLCVRMYESRTATLLFVTESFRYPCSLNKDLTEKLVHFPNETEHHDSEKDHTLCLWFYFQMKLLITYLTCFNFFVFYMSCIFSTFQFMIP